MSLRNVFLAMTALLVLGVVGFGQLLEVGNAVWAQMWPNDWYPGTLTEETDLGYVVVFDDLTEVEGVDENFPSSAEIPRSLIVSNRVPTADQVEIGTRVLAQWPDDEWYYPATVVTDAADGLYDIVFDDRDVTTSDLTQLRLRGGPTELFNIPKVGDRVLIQWEPDDWYPGMLTDTSAVGFRVFFDDETEAERPASLVVVDQAPKADQVAFGSRVLALWPSGWFYPGTVVQVTEEGMYEILPDDGDALTVELTMLRLFSE